MANLRHVELICAERSTVNISSRYDDVEREY